MQRLEQQEAEEAKIKAEKDAEQAAQTQAPAPGKGKADPKKDAGKGKGGKGAATTEDKNSPQQITVTYPETPAMDNYLIIESSFLDSFAELESQLTKKQKGDSKKTDRTKEVLNRFDIIRALPFSIAVRMMLNKEEEVEVTPIQEDEEVPDPKKKK